MAGDGYPGLDYEVYMVETLQLDLISQFIVIEIP
jgi:hypothetical protein